MAESDLQQARNKSRYEQASTLSTTGFMRADVLIE